MFALFDDNLTLIRTVRSPRNLRAPKGVTFADASAVPGETLKANGVYPVRDPGKPDMTGKRLTGTSVDLVDGEAVLVYEVEDKTAEELADDLAAAKAKAVAAIDQQAEQVRQAYITSGDGQAMVYLDKQQEAEAWQKHVTAGQTPSPDSYPHLKRRADRLAAKTGGQADYQAVADEWSAHASAWKVVAVEIEAVREEAKEAVTDAITIAEVQAVQQGVLWPTEESR